MKTKILKINNIYFGIGHEYLECPYTEEYFKQHWLYDVKNLMQGADKSNFGDYWILSCKDLSITYDNRDIKECDPYELKQIFSEYLEVQTSYNVSNKPIIVVNDNSSLNIFVRIK